MSINSVSLVPINSIFTNHTHIFAHKNPPVKVEISTFTVDISTMTVGFLGRETVRPHNLKVFGVTDVRYT